MVNSGQQWRYNTRLETRTKESTAYASVVVTETRAKAFQRAMKVTTPNPQGCKGGRFRSTGKGCEFEHTWWDPKDGELFLDRVKPCESAVEARRNTDVQIVCRIRVKGRKTHRTV